MTRSPPALPAELAAHAEGRYRAFVERAAGIGFSPPPLARLPGDAYRVWACSEFVARSCTQEPALLEALLRSAALESGGDAYSCRERVERAVAGAASVAELMAGLRRVRQRELVRVAWRDLGGLADLEQTVRDLSELAECVLRATLERLTGWLRADLGVPTGAGGTPQSLVVIAMGKLGCRELNFSSDVDLIFAYPENGATAGGRRELSNAEFFLRLGRQLIDVLSQNTDAGFVFRVDMRLRPFGEAGPLVSSFNAMEDYYQLHGRDWERYALIRARPVAGDVAAGHALLRRLRPFVYRRYLDFGALESMREMKQLIAREVKRQGIEDDIKLGPGGIRELEFVVHAFQLVRGGRVAELRGGRIPEMLAALGERGLLPAHAVRELAAAYRFLRVSEHRLQEVDDLQVHRLPSGERERARLACGMRLAGWSEYAARCALNRARVRSHFDQVLGPPARDSGPTATDLDHLAHGQTDDETAVAILAAAGFGDPETAWVRVGKLQAGYATRLAGERTQRRLRRLLPMLLAAAGAGPEPEVTLDRLLTVIESVVRRGAYLALLIERPLALSQLVRLCAASPWIARLLARQPVLLDELLDAETLYSPVRREALDAAFAARLRDVGPGDTEQAMDGLRHEQQANILRVAAADVARTIPLMVVSDYLTDIAEVCLDQALALAWRDLAGRYGEPTCRVDGRVVTAAFAVIGYGKLGGFELGYGSDLDLVFLHDSRGEAQYTDGGKVVDNSVFFARLGRRLIHYLSTPTAAGILYEVDPRLRPSGASGLLVSSFDAFAAYQRDEAWTWEHQALVRARAVAGDAALRVRFAALREEILLLPRDRPNLAREVREMRARMRAELGNSREDEWDIKQDAGGIADIEFMVQYGVLRWAPNLGRYLRFTDNIRLLEGFADLGLMPREDTRRLADAYRAYRARVHVLDLQELPARAGADELAEFRRAVRRIWRDLMEPE